ncbi:MAG: hypothetical protein ACTII7_11870 [Galactobacter sp.]
MANIRWVPESVTHMWERHRVTPDEAEEAIDDPEALLQSPDPAGRSGMSDRYVGWSDTRDELIVVIVIRFDGETYGSNAWPANTTHQRLYEERYGNDHRYPR